MARLFAFLMFLAPIQAHALALGDIKLHSALNQPLDAEVELLSLGEIGLDEINVRLASPEAFERVGLERPFFLTGLEFELAEKDGTPYLFITTKQALKEPFIDFLIEVEWPNGRLLREYTLLLDPPVFLEDGPGAVAAPEAGMAEQPARPAASAAATAGQQGMAQGASGAAATGGELSYGPVSRTDTLWSIAKRLRPDDSVTVPQVMMALLEHNPEAFYRRNVNYLKAGYILRLPDPSAPAAIDPDEAERQIRLQNQQWEDARRQRAGEALKRPAGAGPGMAGSVMESDAAEMQSGQPRLRLVVPDTELGETALQGVADKTAAGAPTEAELDALRRELALALETSAASRQENADLRERLAALEAQIAAMQRLLTLRDDTLAAIQSGALAQSATVQEATAPTVPAPDQQAGQPQAERQERVEAAVTAEQAAGSERKAASVSAAGQQSETPSESPLQNFIDQLLADPMLTAAAGGVGLLVLALAWITVRRRQRGDDDPEAPGALDESAAAESGEAVAAKDDEQPAGTVATDQAAAVSAVVAEIGETVPESGESMGLDVFQPDEDEIDTLAEADVYLAYRRFDKAEELLKEAIAQEPQRYDYVLKLLEVYVASDNRDDFLAQAEALQSVLGEQGGELWDKVVSMGRQLLPDHPLFADESATASTADSTVESDAGSAPQLAGDSETGGEIAPEAAGEGGLDERLAGLSLDDAGEAAEAQDAFAALREEAGFESPLSGAGESAADDGPAFTDFDVEAQAETVSQEGETLDFDIDLDELDEQQDASTAATAGDTGTEVQPLANESVTEIAADEGDVQAPIVQETEGDETETTWADVPDAGGKAAAAGDGAADDRFAAGDNETGDADSDLEADIDWLANLGEEDLSVEMEPAGDEEPDLISGEDEVSTKLDLARAYIDMGDQESARSILDEVLNEGNDDQKGEAEELMRQLG